MTSVGDHRFYLSCFLVLLLIDFSYTLSPHKRFEYKLSFKGPHMVQRDGSIPFWDKGGSTIASDEFIRLTPSLRSKKGYAWSKERVGFQNWEIEMTFKVSGRGRIGADGLAFWYTQDRVLEGPVFGGPDNWKGLGVFFDSFDNDAQHNNPYIMAMTNDGTISYDHLSDGATSQLGGCLRDFRNKPYPSKVKIEYYQNSLTVLFKSGVLAGDSNDYELCLRVEQVHLPPNGYFGITAATGGLADDHDVMAFLTHSLTPPAEAPPDSPPVSEEDKQKFQKEFDEYWRKLEVAKDSYRKEHPDAVVPEEEKDVFEGREVQELRMIFEGQNAMHHTLRDVHRRMDDIVGRQERAFQQMSQVQQQLHQVGTGTQQTGQQQGQGQIAAGEGIQRHEVEQLIRIQAEMHQNMKDVRGYVNDVQSKLQNLQQQNPSPVPLQDLKNSIILMQNDLRAILTKQVAECPQTSCVTMVHLLFLLAVQVTLLVLYSMYRSRKEAAAKKFY